MSGRVVLGFDGLPRTAKAVEYALDVAMQRAATLSVVMATPQWADLPNVVPMLQTRFAAVLQVLKDRARTRGVDMDVKLIAGFPWVEVARVATQQDATLIVLGSRRRHLWRRWIVGSTSERMARLAHCPVVVVA